MADLFIIDGSKPINSSCTSVGIGAQSSFPSTCESLSGCIGAINLNQYEGRLQIQNVGGAINVSGLNISGTDDTEILCLDDSGTSFLRFFTVTSTGTSFVDRTLGNIAYTPTGVISKSDIPDDLEIVCMQDYQSGVGKTSFFRRFISTSTGVYTEDYNLAGAPYTPVGVVSKPTISTAYEKELCLVDDTLNDETTLVPFVRLITIDPDTALTRTIGNFTTDFTAPYTVVGTAKDPNSIGDDVVGVSARRILLEGIGTWAMPAQVQTVRVYPLISNPADPSTVTTDNGTSNLISGVPEEWNVVTEVGSQSIIGSLTVTSKINDTIVINYTQMEV